MRSFLALVAALTLAALELPTARADDRDELAPPVPIMAEGKPIDVQLSGHSAPFVGDIDGDGVRDLLVGQFNGGQLRIYRNHGTNAQPRFEEYTWFKAGAELGRVPVG
jgi:hypothetical protein